MQGMAVGQLEVMQCDLSSFEEIRAFVAQLQVHTQGSDRTTGMAAPQRAVSVSMLHCLATFVLHGTHASCDVSQ